MKDSTEFILAGVRMMDKYFPMSKVASSTHYSWLIFIGLGKSRIVALFLLLFLGVTRGAEPPLTVNNQMAGLTEQRDFPPIKLRGYGQLAGKYWTDKSGDSLLEIQCQDTDHARLVQAKYLSDLGNLLPATQSGEIDMVGTKVSIQTANGVGVVAALRSGPTVILAAAKDAAGMVPLLSNGLLGKPSAWTSVAEGKVPMFLDRFDKYGFRFYYIPGVLKPQANGRGDPTYDPSEDFDFAEATHGGILVWDSGWPSETGEGLNKDAVWGWSLSEAKKRGLSFGINLGLGGFNWYYNRHPESLMQSPPGFLGTYYGSMNFGIPNIVSWSSAAGNNALLAQLQKTVRRYHDVDNITSWLEPHQEVSHGAADFLVEAGPLSDADYQAYLRGKYQTLSALSLRWYGDTASLTSWDKIRAPELADFLGWGGDAIDLAGKWRIDYASADNPAALAGDFDDSSWGEIVGPGHGLARLLPAKPALWRRHANIDTGWMAKHPKVWLYVWDMNDTRGSRTDHGKAFIVSVNGKAIQETPPVYLQDHWAALDVSDALRAGDNVLAIRLPRGVFNYRVYLSGDEPKSYPELGGGKNAQWVDFSAWVEYLRAREIRRGMQMIRQVDPDRGIVLMAPDKYADAIEQDAINYGGDFHNTGYMGGWWCDKLPALMRGVGLPFSVEPGGGPALPIHLLNSFGNWITEGCNAIDHFQNLGEVLWKPELKKCFEDHLAMYTSIGRYHAPFAQIAALYSNRVSNLYGFPWNARPASKDGQPYFRSGGFPSTFNGRDLYAPMSNVPNGGAYESDAVTEENFVRDQVKKYRVVVDTNTSVIDQPTLAGIERYVRAGGVFVTWGETGRHTSEKPDSWPLAPLTGYTVASIPPIKGALSLAQDQQVFSGNWGAADSVTGLSFNPTSPDVKALMKWNDGTTAVGLRSLGKGFVITVGPWFNHTIGPKFCSQLFQWLKIDAIPAHFETTGLEPCWRHFICNNGLYDVWVIRNMHQTQALQGTLVLADNLKPNWAIDLNSGNRISVTDGHLPVSLPPAEMTIYITPSATIAGSTSDWFELQRGWWQGTADPGPPLVPEEMKLTVDLDGDWSYQPVDLQQSDITPLVAPDADDTTWAKMPLGIFTLPDHPGVKRVILRKRFHVPEAWNHGRILLHMPEFRDHANAYLDGRQLSNGYTALLDLKSAAGIDHVLAFDDQGTGALIGARGPAWLTYHAQPSATQSLAGSWQPSTDGLNWNNPAVTLPGTLAQGIRVLRATVRLDKAAMGQTVVIHATDDFRQLSGVIINGNYVKTWVTEAPEMNINITPWIRADQGNEIILLDNGGLEHVTNLSLEFHAPGTYP